MVLSEKLAEEDTCLGLVSGDRQSLNLALGGPFIELEPARFLAVAQANHDLKQKRDFGKTAILFRPVEYWMPGQFTIAFRSFDSGVGPA